MARVRWLDKQEMAAWLAFLEASHRVLRSVERQLRDDSGLSHQQYEILVKLANVGPEGMRMTELAESLITSKSGLTYQIGQLEKRGLVVRCSCPTDVRGVTARLTEDGRSTLVRAAPGHVERVREAMIDVLDREQLVALTDALSVVSTHLRGE